MHVGLNLVYLVPGETGGMEIYARELIPRLAAIDGLRLTAFVNREAAEDGSGPWHDVDHVTVPVHARNRAEWVRGEQQHLPPMAARAGCDVVHSLGSTAPVWGRFARVMSVHDLHYRFVPEAHFGARALGLRVLVPAAVRRSGRILASSHSTRNDLVTALRTPLGKIDVVPLGVGSARARPEGEAALRSKLALGDRAVLLSVSAKRPHKNLGRLLEAHARLPAEDRPVLVVPGYPTPHEDELRALAGRLDTAADVRLEGWLTASEIEGLYEIAAAFAFPSLYEGFGLPVLEAMSRGVPVACSHRKSLGEVAGDAAALFDPEDVADIAAALRRILGDAAEAARLREAGRAQAARFTWERTAQLTVRGYGRALSMRAGSASATP